METIGYLLRVSACTGIFYMFYYLLLRRLTFFTINRWYLMASLIVSLIIPAIKIQVSEQPHYVAAAQQVVYNTYVQPTIQPPVKAGAVNIVAVTEPTNWGNILTLAYLIAVTLLMVHLAITLVVFFVRIKGKPIAKMGGVKILSGDKKLGNGSFFNYIFLADSIAYDELKHVIAHEMLHVKLRHSVDRMLARMLQIVLWFNPFAYLYARAIEANHEFEVDSAMANTIDKRMYAGLLLQLSATGHGMLFNGFSKAQLTKRINMLFNKPSKNMRKLTYMLIVPMVTISCLVFATSLKTGGKKLVKTTKADTVSEKYRQKLKSRNVLDAAKAKYAAYMKTSDFKNKSKVITEMMSKDVIVKVKGIYNDESGGINHGFLMTYDSVEFKIRTGYGQEKQLDKILKPGDVVTMKAFYSSIMPNDPLYVTPAYVKRNDTKIFQFAEADKLPNYPFLYEANRVRFADGQMTHIEKYSNGKWKSALLETINGYKFNISFKSDAPYFTNIEWGDHVRFRFVHEIKAGRKIYNVNDWVSISHDLEDHRFKNPEMFYKFYEKM